MEYVIQLPPSKGQPSRMRYISGFGPHINFTGRLQNARRFQSSGDASQYMVEQRRRDRGARVIPA